MGWFDEQIRQRRQHDRDAFEEAFIEISDTVTGARASAALADERSRAKDAIGEILKFYHIKPQDVPETIKDTNEQLEFLLRPHGIMRRNVNLEKGWYEDAIGAMLGVRKADGSVVALIPTGLSGYSFFDAETGERVKVSRKNEDLFETEAIAFYKPFPLQKIDVGALLKYIAGILSGADYALAALATLAVTLVSMLGPKLNQLLFGLVAESGEIRLLASLALFMVCAEVSKLLITSAKSLIMARIQTKMDVTVQAAAMARIMSLPAAFFKGHSSGELFTRSQYINALCTMLVDAVLSTGLTSIFSLVYISQIFAFAPALVAPALLIIAATLLFSLITVFVRARHSREEMELNAKVSGMTHALISGVQKIKLSGAERRAFARWGKLYARQSRAAYNAPTILRYNSVVTMFISLTGTLVMYYMAFTSGVSVADYYAFNAAYGMVSGAFLSLAGVALTAANIKPVLDMAKPILDAVPEVSEGKQVITRLSGGIELNNVSFRYSENMPNVIDDLSLKIRPGQYVAIVGSTGCGKSTLMRLMLGFETPQKGAVYYDGKDLAGIDLKSLRRRIGTVMQDSKLFQGDIFSNITISAPWLKLDDAWEAAEKAGIAEDIRAMPMGMHTIISEGSGGVSGGQRQRLAIARAIAPKPKILMFDEATSALDNLTQKTVSESLDALKCTRVVIAHRLSTIRQCDRIIYLEKGHIVEDGTYEELIAKNGKFADLVARQRLDND